MTRRPLRLLSEYGLAGSALGVRSMMPTTYVTTPLSKKQQARLERARVNKAKTQERLRDIAQEGLPERRALKTLTDTQ